MINKNVFRINYPHTALALASISNMGEAEHKANATLSDALHKLGL